MLPNLIKPKSNKWIYIRLFSGPLFETKQKNNQTKDTTTYKKFISVKNTIPEAHVIINKAFLKNLNTLLAINTKKQAQQVFEAFKKSTVILEKQWLEEKIKEQLT